MKSAHEIAPEYLRTAIFAFMIELIVVLRAIKAIVYWLGGGGEGSDSSPPGEYSQEATRADIDVKLSVPYLASICHSLTKFQQNLSRSVAENDVLVTFFSL